ncbi:unnamed protein product [Clonostachys solani]|uniref:Uncharacterized protein n=1 Tax=Clonostachys solani TaxID=160281 RepID=A0A9N9ZRC2_9HYPO|nr:unnamed protein product [Clonostachys solani]
MAPCTCSLHRRRPGPALHPEPLPQHPPRARLSHHRPPPQPLDFEDNADVIALKSTISMLQMQSRHADSHIRTLRDVKGEALRRPEDFVQHLAASQGDRAAAHDGSAASPDWPELPDRISIARCPPINWSQYAVVGDALEKIHDEQVKRPVQGTPGVYANGVYEFKGGEGRQEDYPGPTAPYDPLNEHVGKKPKSKK